MCNPVRTLLLAALLSWYTASSAASVINHDLHVSLQPARGELSVRDHITLPTPTPARGWIFALHAHLRVNVVGNDVHLTALDSYQDGGVPVRRYRLALPAGADSVDLEYSGRITSSADNTDGNADGSAAGNGRISTTGVYLDGASYWYPWFGDDLRTFRLQVQMPDTWRAVSQGGGDAGNAVAGNNVAHWHESQPQEDIVLSAAVLNSYQQSTPWGTAMVLLRKPDSGLAQRYLDATAQYLDFYSRLIGPYPYAKFALVENFWESGSGLPSFTLLGSRVIRMPFIIDSSYPHEILHNWWGNGVYVEFADGNWSEGLTTYLADYLMAERRGQGAEYRRGALQQYADYVADGRDFPLARFRGRHGDASQAVGYAKGAMFFHMLRRRLGDAKFIAGLRLFYRDNKFRRAGFRQLQAAFERASGEHLGGFFQQWVQRTGAPQLRVRDISVQSDGAGYRVRGILEQSQSGPNYTLRVPVAVQIEGAESAVVTSVNLSGRRATLDLHVPIRPLRLAIDPGFDVFRLLDRDELPPSVGQLFGATNALYVLPAAASPDLRAGYRSLADQWADRADQVVWDTDLKVLPTDRPVWVLGWRNRFRADVAAVLAARGVSLDDQQVHAVGQTLPRETTSVVLVGRQPRNPEAGLAWLGCDNPAALPGLARKLPHYGKYSYLAFSDDAPTNFLKGQWTVVNSPLIVRLAHGNAPLAPLHLTPRAPLAPPAAAGADTPK